MALRSILVALLLAAVALVARVAWPVAADGPGVDAAAEPAAPVPMPEQPATADAAPLRDEVPTPGAEGSADGARTVVAGAKPPAPAVPGELCIEVRDAAERSVAGVPVGLRVDRGGATRLRWRGATGADGRVRAPDLRSGDRGGPGDGDDDAGAVGVVVSAVLAFPFAGGDRVAVERDHPPVQPIVLHLPPTGVVDVEVVDPAVPVVGDGIAVGLRVFADAGDARGGEAVVAVERGHAVFPFVGLGLRLEAEVERVGQSATSTAAFDGPLAVGQIVRATVSLVPAGATVIVAKVEDEDGRACRATRLDHTIEGRNEHGTSSNSSQVTSDGDGVVRIVLDDGLGAEADRHLELNAAAATLDVQSVRAALPRPLPAGEVNLGTLRLARPPVACAGVVVDEAGEGIVGAELQVQSRERAGDGRWDDERGLRGSTVAAGAFTVRGATGGGELRVRVDAPGYLPFTSQPFPPATTGLWLSLQRAAGLAGSVVLAPPLEAADVLVELVGAQGTDRQRLERRGDRGVFELTSLRAGTVEVRLRAIGDVRGELRVPDVALRAGELTRDERLQDVDLLDGRRAASFAVVDTEGAPVREAMVFVLDGDPQQRRFEGLLLPHGTGRLFAVGGTVEVLVTAEGHGCVRAVVADGGRVELPAAVALRLRLPVDLRLLDGETLLAHAAPVEPMVATTGEYVLYAGEHATRSGRGTLPWAGGASARADRGGVDLRLCTSGRHRLWWALERGGREVAVGGRREITVADGGATELEAGITAADLARARQR